MNNTAKNNRKYTWLFPLLLLVFFAGCYDDNGDGYGSTNGPPAGGPGANEVWMQNIAFTPGTITISVGTTITWTNKDNVIHTVTSGTPGNASGFFNSGNMSQGATFTYTFDTAGTYEYYCIPHSSNMTATVIVQ